MAMLGEMSASVPMPLSSYWPLIKKLAGQFFKF